MFMRRSFGLKMNHGRHLDEVVAAHIGRVVIMRLLRANRHILSSRDLSANALDIDSFFVPVKHMLTLQFSLHNKCTLLLLQRKLQYNKPTPSKYIPQHTQRTPLPQRPHTNRTPYQSFGPPTPIFSTSSLNTLLISPAIFDPSSSSRSSLCPRPNMVQLLFLISGMLAGRGMMWKCTWGTTWAALAPMGKKG